MVQWVTEGFNSQFRRADSRVWCRDLRIQESKMQLGEVNVAFKEPVHKIVDRIKNELFFRWPKKMGGDPSRRN